LGSSVRGSLSCLLSVMSIAIPRPDAGLKKAERLRKRSIQHWSTARWERSGHWSSARCAGPEEPLFNYLIAQYHPLGYTQPVGEHLKYLVYAAGRPIACLAWSSAPRHLSARDRYIGWTLESRCRNLRFLAYNPRFLVLPWIQVKHLASHILGLMARRLSGDWERLYHHPVYFLETFVDTEKHRGTCYRAANWVVMGRTAGRGNNCPDKRQNRSIKEVLGYPLTPRFRKLLIEG